VLAVNCAGSCLPMGQLLVCGCELLDQWCHHCPPISQHCWCLLVLISLSISPTWDFVGVAFGSTVYHWSRPISKLYDLPQQAVTGGRRGGLYWSYHQPALGLWGRRADLGPSHANQTIRSISCEHPRPPHCCRWSESLLSVKSLPSAVAS